jgi:hypothetical protein
MGVWRRLRRHGLMGTIKLIPRNVRHLWQSMTPKVRQEREEDLAFDRKHGTRTSGSIPLGALNVDSETERHATYYLASSVRDFTDLLASIPEDFSRFRFIDYGSGLGRALLLASHYPFKEIIGIEFAEKLHRIAEENLKAYRSAERVCFDVKALLTDAATYSPPIGPTVFYFFNPFGPELMARIIARIEARYKNTNHPLYVAYNNALHADVFLASGFWEKLAEPRFALMVFRRRLSG